MSVDALRARLRDDIEQEIIRSTAVLTEGRHAPLDDLRWHQGLIAGLKAAQNLLDERYRNLYAM